MREGELDGHLGYDKNQITLMPVTAILRKVCTSLGETNIQVPILKLACS